MKIYPFLLCSISAFRIQKVSGDKISKLQAHVDGEGEKTA